MMFVNSTGIMSYFFALMHKTVCGYSAVICYSIYISIFTSQVYIFIKNLFTSVHSGKLIGFASMVGGVSSLLSNWLYETVTMKYLNGDPKSVMWSMIGVLAASQILLIPMHIGARRKAEQIMASKYLLSRKSSAVSETLISLFIKKKCATEEPQSGTPAEAPAQQPVPLRSEEMNNHDAHLKYARGKMKTFFHP